MWPMNLSGEILETESYPERPGELDCSYYIRTGSCRFGTTCRFNHPPNRKLVIAAARLKGEFPERLGQPECQYYLKTGTCKFGATCKFHHPKDKAGITGRVSLNIYGYPLRPGEIECAYYLRTGQCKFGNTCKFDHPQPSNMVVSLRGSPIYQTFSSPTTPTQQSFPGVANWPLSRTSFMTSPRWQSPSSYAPVIVPQGMVTMSNWNSYTSQSQTPGSGQVFGEAHQSDLSNSSSQGAYPPFGSGSLPFGFYSLGRENVFPERPGQPECQFYMKTGDCKFGIVCRFHHPQERLVPAPDCLLSSIGLPLRPGEPLCVFYSRYGICKFGSSCKFNHPMGIFPYNQDLSSSPTEMRCLLESSFPAGNAPPIPPTPMQMVDGINGKTRRLPLSEATAPIGMSISSPVDETLSRDSTWRPHTESE